MEHLYSDWSDPRRRYVYNAYLHDHLNVWIAAIEQRRRQIYAKNRKEKKK